MTPEEREKLHEVICSELDRSIEDLSNHIDFLKEVSQRNWDRLPWYKKVRYYLWRCPKFFILDLLDKFKKEE